MAIKGFNNKSKSSLPIEDISLAKRLATKHPAPCLSLVKDMFIGGTITKIDSTYSFENDFGRALIQKIADNHPTLVIPVLIDILVYAKSSDTLDFINGMLTVQLAREHPEETAMIIKNTILCDHGVSSRIRNDLYTILKGMGKTLDKKEQDLFEYNCQHSTLT